MSDNLVTLPEVLIDSEATLAMTLARIASAKRELKQFESAVEQAGIMYMQANGIKAIQVSDTVKIILSTKKKETWKVDEVFDLFSFTPEQRRILSSPKFKKTELAKELGGKAEVKDLLIVEELPDLELKELDTKFIK